MSVRPRTRVATSHGPTRIEGAFAVDRYLLALAGQMPLSGYAFDALERDFVAHAKHFAARRGISYDAWCDVGVTHDVLARADIGVESLANCLSLGASTTTKGWVRRHP